MTPILKTILAGAGAAMIALPAAAQPDTPHDCFLVRDLRNHTVGDDHTLYFDVGGRSVYRAEMSNNCFAAVSSSDPIVLRDKVGTGRICKPLELDVAAQGTRCIVSSLTRLTPAEVAALPRRVKP
jgi:hypothetical protein